jgi:hypothetical protein
MRAAGIIESRHPYPPIFCDPRYGADGEAVESRARRTLREPTTQEGGERSSYRLF